MGDNAKVVAAAAAAALVGAAATYFFLTSKAAGDEPPIHVKGGSMHLELLHASVKWEQQGNPRNWTVRGPNRASEDYLVYIAPTNPGAHCPGGTVGKQKKTVTFIHFNPGTNQTTEVELKATGKKTKVTSERDLVLESGQRLSYTDGGYIREIRFDGQAVCTFTQPGDLDSVLLTEGP